VRRLYYGWYLVAGLGLATIVSYGITQYLFGVLLLPIERDLGASRASVSAAFSGGVLVWGLLGVPVGRLIDQVGARWPMAFGSVLGAACLFALSRISELWQLYAVWSLGLGLAMALTLYPVTFTVVANFFHSRRGRALAVLTLIGGLSSPIYIPAAGWLVAQLGWREAVQVLAVSALLVALPVHALLVRRRPEDLGLHADGESGAAPDVTAPIEGVRLRAALGTRTFWLLTAAAGLSSAAFGVVLAHAVAFLINSGYPPTAAAAVVGLTGVLSLPGRLVFNLASDRAGPQGLLAACTAGLGLGVLFLILAGPAIWVAAFVVVYGLAFGAVSPLRAGVLAEHFGRVAYGSITAFQNLPSAFMSATGPLAAGLLFDRLGDYRLAFALTAAAFALAGLLIFLTPRPRRSLQPSVQD
ncbi:MAG TPA: MFS transporter, partial [Candidatus Dormibacteraeota bacterium]